MLRGSIRAVNGGGVGVAACWSTTSDSRFGGIRGGDVGKGCILLLAGSSGFAGEVRIARRGMGNDAELLEALSPAAAGSAHAFEDWAFKLCRGALA